MHRAPPLPLLVLLAVLVVIPGGQATAAQGPSPLPASSAAETPLEGLLRQAVLDGRDDPRARAAAMQTFVAERWGSERDPSPSTSAAEAEPLETEYNIWPRPASDLDGDGGGDVIVNGSSYPDGPEVLEARSGTDGRVLWSIVSDEPVGAFGWPIGVDVTGDGVEDVLVVATIELDSTTTDTCVTGEVINCSIEVDTTYTTTTTVRSGADGSEVWTVSREGEEHFEVGHSGTPAGYEVWQRLDASNALVTPYLSGDHDGDGLPDLVLNARGMEWDDHQSGYDLVVAGEWSGHSRQRYDTEAVLVSGATGAETPVRSVVDSTTAADLRPLDRAGDALLWTAMTRPDSSYTCSHTPLEGECVGQEEPDTAEMEALDGQALATRWTVPINTGDTPVPLDVDLTGDGVAEVFLSERSHVGSELLERGSFVDGVTGSTLWARDGWWFPEVVPSLDGGEGADVLRITSLREGGERVQIAERIDGATGESLRMSKLTPDPEGADDVYWGVAPVGDISGDGVPDLAWRTYRLDRGDPCPVDGSGGSACWFFPYATTTQIWVEDTRTGATVVPEWRVDGYGSLAAAGDLDGDGRDDLLRLEAADGPMAYHGLDGVTQQVQWTTTFDALTHLTGIGDLDGVAGDDLMLEAVVEADGARTSYLGGVSGLDGVQGWSVRYG